MSISTYSHNLIVHDWYARQDGKVVIRFSITQPGLYWSLPQVCRAFAPGDTVGRAMTPAYGDIQHVVDPLIVSANGQIFTWVWDAVADGIQASALNGWTLFLGYLNLYCCEGDTQPEVEDVPIPEDPIVPQDPPPLTGPNPPPATGPTTGVDIPINPLPPPTYPTPNINDPAQGYFDAEKFHQPEFWPYTPGMPSPWGPVVVSQPTSIYGYTAGPLAPEAYGFVRDSNGVLRDRYGNIVIWDGVVDPLASYQMQMMYQTQRLPVQPAPVSPSNFGSIQQQQIVHVPVQEPTRIDPGEQPAGDVLLAPQVETRMSATSLILPSQTEAWSIRASVWPNAAPADAHPIVFTSVKNLTAGEMQGMSVTLSAVDSAGVQWTLSSQNLGTVAPNGTAGAALCTNWTGLPTGPLTLTVTLLSPGGIALVSFTMVATILPPGTLPTPPPPPEELPKEVREAAWGVGAADIPPIYEGSYNAIGHEDCYVITTKNDASHRVGIVVTIPEDAKNSGFKPVLKVFTTQDLNTPVFTHELKFNVSEQGRAKHAIGWIDREVLHYLDEDRRYLIQVVNKYPFWSRRWAFKIYTQETPRAFSENLAITSNQLSGSITCGYGRQSLKIENMRTHEVLFVETDPEGVCSDVQMYAHPAGARMAVATGDKLRIFRPGPGVQYKSTDLIGTAQV